MVFSVGFQKGTIVRRSWHMRPRRALKNSQERGYRGPGGCPPRFRKPGREPSPKAACDVAEASRDFFGGLLGRASRPL